jgi:hypothetical protein
MTLRLPQFLSLKSPQSRNVPTQPSSISPVQMPVNYLPALSSDECSGDETSRMDAHSVIEMDRCSEWSEVKDVNPRFYSRTGHTVTSLGGDLYIFGGTNYKNMNNELWRYNELEFVQLKPDGDVITARSSCKSCASPGEDTIYFYGGYSNRKDNCFEDLYSYNINSNMMK